jgi:hypothetical protein
MVERYIIDANNKIQDSDFSKEPHGDLRGMLTYLSTITLEFQSARLGVYRAAQRLAQTAPEIWLDTGNLTVQVANRVGEFLNEYTDEITADDKATAMTNAVQLIVLVIFQTRLGSGILFPKQDSALLAMLVDAAMGILQPKENNV